MINSHYVPQFILRNFYTDEKITYCDLEQKRIELRNSRSVFSEKGYYPEGIEYDLCKKAEHQFANLYHNKMENSQNNVTFTRDELFIIKKYLIVSTVRYKYDYSEEDIAFQQSINPTFKIDFDRCLNDILACENEEDVVRIMNKAENCLLNRLDGKEPNEQDAPGKRLWAEMKDVLHSYLIFVKPQRDEKFLIPDVGRGIYKGPLGMRKLTSAIDAMMHSHNPQLAVLLQMISPRDYSIFPLSKNLAVITMCPFYKIFTKSEFNVRIIMPDEYPTLSSILRFGDSDTIAPPKVSVKGITREYKYEIKRLVTKDVCHLNSLMIDQAKRYIACADLKDIQGSIEMASEHTTRDLSFMKI